MILPQSSTGPSDTLGGAMLSWGWSITPGELVVAIAKSLGNIPRATIKSSKYFQSMSALDLGYLGYWDLTEVQKILKQVKGCHGGLPWMAIGLWFWWLPLVGIRHIRHLHCQMEYWMGHSGCQDIEIRNPKNLLKDFERLQKIIHTLLRNFPKLTFLKWW